MKSTVFSLEINHRTVIYFNAETVAPYSEVEVYLIDNDKEIIIGKGIWKEIIDMLQIRLSRIALNKINYFVGKLNNLCLWYIFNADLYKNDKLEESSFSILNLISDYEFLCIPSEYNISSWLYNLDGESILEISMVYDDLSCELGKKRFLHYMEEFKPYKIYKLNSKNIAEWNNIINKYFDLINKKQHNQQYWI